MISTENLTLNAGNEIFLFFKYLGTVGAAQAITKTLLAPLERVKIIFQVQNAFLIEESSKIRSIGSFFVRVPKEQGFKALWRGNGANLITIFSKSTVAFTFYDNINRYWLPGGEQNFEGFDFVARKGAVAFICGCTTLLFTYPFDLALTKLSLDYGSPKERVYKGIFNSLKQTVSLHGFRALYKGFLLSSLSTVPFFATFGFSLRGFQELRASTESLSGYEIASASLIAHIINYPLDTLRRRLQISTAKYTEPYKGFRDCLNKIRKTEGLGALYKGLGISVIRHGFAVPIQGFAIQVLRDQSFYDYKKYF